MSDAYLFLKHVGPLSSLIRGVKQKNMMLDIILSYDDWNGKLTFLKIQLDRKQQENIKYHGEKMQNYVQQGISIFIHSKDTSYRNIRGLWYKLRHYCQQGNLSNIIQMGNCTASQKYWGLRTQEHRQETIHSSPNKMTTV